MSPTEGAGPADRPVVALLGGTFDPVHWGHLHAVKWVRRVVAPSRVLLVPCATPAHKTRRDLSPAAHRLAMLRAAARGRSWLEVSTMELDRGGVSYTIDTLRALAAGPPAVSPLFIMGMDSLFEIHTWRCYLQLMEEFDLIVVDRPGRDLDRSRSELDAEAARRLVAVACEAGALADLSDPRPGSGGRVYHLPIPPLDISSSRIRARAAAGAPLDGLVPSAVARYIQRHELYGQEESR